MDDKLFSELLASTKEAKEILAKKTAPSRTFYIDEPNAKEIRSKFDLTQDEFVDTIKKFYDIIKIKDFNEGRS